MSDYDRQELSTLVRDAVREAISVHPCRFSDAEAKTVHQIADTLSRDQVQTLSMVASALNGAGSRLGQAIVWGLMAAALGALLAMVRMGLLRAE